MEQSDKLAGRSVPSYYRVKLAYDGPADKKKSDRSGHTEDGPDYGCFVWVDEDLDFFEKDDDEPKKDKPKKKTIQSPPPATHGRYIRSA
jgi:hypothetical protein